MLPASQIPSADIIAFLHNFAIDMYLGEVLGYVIESQRGKID